MTSSQYRRPRTSTVNALGGVGTPNSIQVKGDSQIQVSAAGRVIDKRNPNQLIRNAEASTAAISSFVNTITNQAPKVIEGALMDQANRQMSELVSSTSPKDLMAVTSDGPERDLMRGLNVFAQEKLAIYQANHAANEYRELTTADVEKNQALLTNPSTSDEVKAQVMSDIKEDARQRSRLGSVPAGAYATVMPQLAAFEGQLRGLNHKKTLARQKERDLLKVQNGLLSSVASYLSEGEEPEGKGNVELAAESLKREISDPRSMFTPREQADELYSGVETRVAMLISEGNADAAVAMANRMVDLSKTSIKTPSGEYFFDIRDSQGKNLTLKLSKLANNALREQQQQGALNIKRLSGEHYIDYNKAVTPAEKDAVSQEFLGKISTLPPEQRAAALVAMGQVEARLDAPTELQIQNAAEARLKITTRGFNKEDSSALLLELLNRKGITTTQYSIEMSNVAAGNPDADLYNNIGVAEKTAKVDIEIFSLNLVDIGNVEPAGAGSSALADYKDEEKSVVVEQQLRKQTLVAIEKQARKAKDEGNPWTQQMIVDKYKDELENQYSILEEKLRKGVIGGKTMVQRVNEEYRYLGDNSNKGPLTVNSFSPETVKRFKRMNKGKEITVKNLLGSLANSMKGLKKKDGTPIYEDPVKEMKALARESRLKEDKYGFWETSNPLNFMMGTPQLKELDTIQEVERIPEQGKDDKEKTSEKNDTTSKADDTPPEGFKRVLMQGLGALGNVVTQPAQAGTLEGKPGILNSGNTDEFAKVMSRRIPMGIKTQALPQVSAATQVRRAPIAIASRNHPIFVAIGIAEGTRTPSGGNTKAYYGHTDIGDGNWNRGTVSGGRNGGTPQQVDREWMGILTSVSTTMAPVLQRLGLPPNSQGWNRVMFNILDLRVQAAPEALETFVSKLPQVIKQGLTIEAIAKARADSFFNPRTGALEASGFGNNYSRLFADQRSRAGVYDYKRRF